jgi:hypothetical protein
MARLHIPAGNYTFLSSTDFIHYLEPFYKTLTGAVPIRVRLPGREANNSLTSSIDIKDSGAITSLPISFLDVVLN